MAIKLDQDAYGTWLIAIASLIGLVVALFGYMTPNDGISYTPGALLVVVSSALILAASILLSIRRLPRWLVLMLDVLLLLGILGTALAAWFLQTDLLVGLMVVGLVGWLVRLMLPRLAGTTTNNAGATS